MQTSFPRRGDMQPEYPEHSNIKPVAEIEGALREVVRRDIKTASSKEQRDTATNVGSIVQRATSLAELKSLILELQRLHDFMQSEGERLEEEIAEYARLSKSATGSTRLIADSMLHWKKASAEEQ
jgi:hypothetical protein